MRKSGDLKRRTPDDMRTKRDLRLAHAGGVATVGNSTGRDEASASGGAQARSFMTTCDEMVTLRMSIRRIVAGGHLHRVRRAEQTTGMPALRHHWSAAQVRALIEDSPTHWPRYELMGGELIVTPAPGGIHQVAVAKILVLLAGYLTREPVGVALASPADLQLHPDTIAQPDIFVAPRVRPAEPDHVFSWADIASLLLAIEVISPSSERTDRVEKRDHYMSSARVAEYWVVDLDARVLERWNPERVTPMVARSTLEWRPAGAGKPLTIDLVPFFEEIWSDYRAIGG